MRGPPENWNIASGAGPQTASAIRVRQSYSLKDSSFIFIDHFP